MNEADDATWIAVEAAELTTHGAASVMYLNDRQVEKCEEWNPVRKPPDGQTTEADSEYARP